MLVVNSATSQCVAKAANQNKPLDRPVELQP